MSAGSFMTTKRPNGLRAKKASPAPSSALETPSKLPVVNSFQSGGTNLRKDARGSDFAPGGGPSRVVSVLILALLHFELDGSIVHPVSKFRHGGPRATDNGFVVRVLGHGAYAQ